ncbi:ribosome-binding factor A, partial [Selenomonas artemidis]
MSKVRVEKVQELMKQEISDIILHDLKDPRIGFVTVTSVA